MATVTLKDVRKSYGAVNIIQGVDLAIQDREFVVFVGPSGCGKSTLLRMIAGLEEITAGDLLIDGAVVNDVPPDARVAIGRAIVRQPKVFLFDEPLSNLDASLRVQMRIEIARLHSELKATMIYVTHDQVEAMTMADRIVVLRAGKIEQVGSPLELYHYPANTFVAGFIGSPKMNLTPATVKSSHANGVDVTLPGGGVTSIAVEPRNATPGAPCTVGFRPESLSMAAEGPWGGKVAVVEHLGGETLVYVDIGDGHLVTVKTPGSTSAQIGDIVRLAVNTDEARLFDKDGIAMTPMHRRAIAGMAVAAQ